MFKQFTTIAMIIPLLMASQARAAAPTIPDPQPTVPVVSEAPVATPTIQPTVTPPMILTQTETALIEQQPPDYEINSLFDGRITSHGGYGAFGYKATSIDGQTGHMTGGRAGWIINHSLTIGGAGYGLADSKIKREFDGEMKRLHFGYGGLEVGYTFFSNQLIHVTAHALFAGGGIGAMDKVIIDETIDEDDDCENYSWEGPFDTVFVIEPMIYAELNVTDWFRVSLGGGYRHVEGCELKGVSNQDLSGASAEILFKFGYF